MITITCQVHLQHAVYGQCGDLLPFQLPPLIISIINESYDDKDDDGWNQETACNPLETLD